MIWGSHYDEYEDGCLLACSAVWIGISLPTMQAVQTSETLVNLYQSTGRYNLEDSHLVNKLFLKIQPKS
jgi:hypothetical protein